VLAGSVRRRRCDRQRWQQIITTDAIEEHLEKISDEADLPVMTEILIAVRERQGIKDKVFRKLNSDDVIELYDNLLGPVIDRIEAKLRGDIDYWG